MIYLQIYLPNPLFWTTSFPFDIIARIYQRIRKTFQPRVGTDDNILQPYIV